MLLRKKEIIPFKINYVNFIFLQFVENVVEKFFVVHIIFYTYFFNT